MNALLSGELDAIEQIDMKTIGLLQRSAHVVIEEVSSSRHVAMPMWTDTAPFDNIDVRLALKLAVDRREMVDKILRDRGRVANDQPIAPSYRFFAGDIEQRVYDPERARFHLNQAGYGRLAVDLHVADVVFAGAVDAAVLYREQAARAGIDVNVIREPSDGYWSSVWNQVPFCMGFWSGRPTEDWMFSQVYASDASWNDTRWHNERFDRLLKQARVERDQAQRADLYREMQLLVRNDGGVIVPMYANYMFARSTRVTRRPQIAANWSMDGWKSIERWWLS
jgi:peptide/nickel transport system substrate-binding protein